jgi:Ricin-type beta-trefoil lectin domain
MKSFKNRALVKITAGISAIFGTFVLRCTAANAVSFVLKDGSNKAINVWLGSNAQYKFDGYPRAFVLTYNPNDREQQFNELRGNHGGTLYQVKDTNLCLNGHYNYNGAPINVWRCDANDRDQNWQLISLNGSTHLRNVTTGRCADSVSRGVAFNNLHMWDCSPGNPNQQFNVKPDIIIDPPKGDISLPFRNGQAWYVCQGYNGPISHQRYPALDLTVDSRDVGRDACWAKDGNVNKSKDQAVLSPAAGRILHFNGRPDLVCLQIDDRRSILIGHIRRSVDNGQSVSEGTQLGTVAPSTDAKVGGYAHIHVEARKSSNCAIGTAVPFTKAEGFQFREVGDLPGNQTHHGRELRKP